MLEYIVTTFEVAFAVLKIAAGLLLILLGPVAAVGVPVVVAIALAAWLLKRWVDRRGASR